MPRKNNKRNMNKGKQSFRQKVVAIVTGQKESKSTQVVSFSGTNLTTSTVGYLCNDIDTGDTKASREGEQVYIRSIGGRFTIGYNSAGSASAQVVRVVLYRPRQLDNILSSITYTEYIDPSEQIVLVDKLFTVNAENPVKICNLGWRFYNKRTPNGMVATYSSGTGTDIQTGPVYIALCSDQATNGPTLNGTIRCFFKER